MVGLQSAGRELPDLFSMISLGSLRRMHKIKHANSYQCIGVGLSHGMVSQALK